MQGEKVFTLTTMVYGLWFTMQSPWFMMHCRGWALPIFVESFARETLAEVMNF